MMYNFLVPSLGLALYRAATIAAGIIAALLVNSLLFPRHCRVGFEYLLSLLVT